LVRELDIWIQCRNREGRQRPNRLLILRMVFAFVVFVVWVPPLKLVASRFRLKLLLIYDLLRGSFLIFFLFCVSGFYFSRIGSFLSRKRVLLILLDAVFCVFLIYSYVSGLKVAKNFPTVSRKLFICPCGGRNICLGGC
jgi:hypothetical protein